MNEFIIEYELEKVVSSTTREYLKEVISSYNLGNYRSAIVVLYSVVIFDLIEKMKILSEIYQDKTATEVLDILKGKEDKNTSYSEREKYLIEEVKKRELLTRIEFDKIQKLREVRNWCAHPVHNYDYKLINPSREEVRAYLRICFESVFQKEALLSRKILNDILQMSNDYYDKVELNGLERYLSDRFYTKMNQSVKDKTFKSLWDIVFKVSDEQCDKTRISSYYALLFLVNSNPEHYYELVKNDNKRYSNIQMPENEIKFKSYYAFIGNSPAEALIYMLAEHPKFYNNITEAAKAIIDSVVNKNISYLTISYYLSESMEQHLAKLTAIRDSLYIQKNGYSELSCYDIFSHEDLLHLYNKSLELSCENLIKEFIINLYINAPSYKLADYLWEFIHSCIEIFKENELKLILNGMNTNNQIYESRNINSIMYNFKKYYKIKTNNELDITNYNNLR